MVAKRNRSDQIRAAEIREEDKRSIRKMSIAEITEKNFKKTWGVSLDDVLKGEKLEKLEPKPKKSA